MDNIESCIKSGIVRQNHFLQQVSLYLKNRFPNTVFRLSIRRYPGGKSLKVYWQDGPAKSALNEFVDTFQGCQIKNMVAEKQKTFISFHDKTVYGSWGMDFILLKRQITK